MAKSKDILEVITKTQLVEISRHLGFKSWQVISKGEIVKRLSRQRTTPMDEILNHLKINELRYICSKLNLNMGGLKKETLIDRILGKEGAKKPEQKRIPKFDKADIIVAKPKPKHRPTTVHKQPMKRAKKRAAEMTQNNNSIAELENRLWNAADQLRANSALTAQEYSRPVLGLIFLKYANQRFTHVEKELANEATGRRRIIGKLDYQEKGVLYLPENARFSNLIKMPEGSDIGKALNDGMDLIESENEDLRGVLPRTYNRLENALLFELLRLFNSIPMDIEGDVFGRYHNKL